MRRGAGSNCVKNEQLVILYSTVLVCLGSRRLCAPRQNLRLTPARKESSCAAFDVCAVSRCCSGRLPPMSGSLLELAQLLSFI